MKPRLLLPERLIRARVQILAEEILRYYEADGRRLDRVLVVLKGSILFAADLLRWLNPDIHVDFVRAKSYHGDAQSPSAIVEISGLTSWSRAQNILIIEDIVDTGNTIEKLVRHVLSFDAAAKIEVCTLLNKPSRRNPLCTVEPRFVGFTIEDLFVYGYGLDLNEQYRGLPDIMELCS